MHSNIPAPTLFAFNVPRTTSTPVLESQNRYAALSVEECDDNNDNDNDIPLKGCTDASPARAETKAANPAGHEAESLSMLPLRKLGQTGANRSPSSSQRETRQMKGSDKTSPTNAIPIDTASLPRRTDGTWDKLKYTPCEALSQDEQAAPTQRSPITTVSAES
ncbi:uncharacterized protein ARMOST_08556 [Armillaria ostoyae]|uniref:Uncharacterized protein n=1 Tax=Armillaria ostoyae TaxID=47428 RepID=A0A284R910_ARMOS|nr:uncharacterized protein ARMOST_08556 [Armillaria ostoyae]